MRQFDSPFLKGGRGILFLGTQLVSGTVPEVAMAWGMGFASHFLADALWHP